MATDPRLRADLLKKLGGVTSSRMYQLAAELKANHGPMGTDDAMYVLAHQKGLDLTKYMDDKAAVDRIRSLVPRNTGPAVAAATPAKKTPAPAAPKTRTPISRTIRVGSTAAAAELLLPKAFEDDAERMSNLYPKMYLLENSIRSVIVRVLAARYGKDWWTPCAPTDVRNGVQGRKAKEAKVPWHGKRGSHEIYYSDFGDLRKIIEHKWDDFSAIFPSRPWITQKLEELEPGRNILAHHNPVPANEQKRWELHYDDWAALIKDRRGAIPD